MARKTKAFGDESRDGLPVDRSGGPTVDPTENVKDLSKALSIRQDDLREANNKYLEARLDTIERILHHSADHAREVTRLESSRLDKIRQVDIQNSTRAEERAGEAIKTLAIQTTTNAEVLRTMVASSASTLAAQLSGLFTESNKRLSALELSFSEGRGKQAVTDPQITEMLIEIRALRTAQSLDQGKAQVLDPAITATLAQLLAKVDTNTAKIISDTGKSAGIADSQKLLTWILGIALALMSIWTFTHSTPAPVSQPYIYTPAPTGTQLPSNPPTSVPR